MPMTMVLPSKSLVMGEKIEEDLSLYLVQITGSIRECYSARYPKIPKYKNKTILNYTLIDGEKVMVFPKMKFTHG